MVLLEKEDEEKLELIKTQHAKQYLEDYIGIHIGNINLERVHFPKEFTETKIKIQQNHYQQEQLNVENKTLLLKKENEQKLIKVATDTESSKILTLAETKQKETLILTDTESSRILKLAETKQKETLILTDTESGKIIKLAEARREEKIISAKAQSEELEILNKSIKENPDSYRLKILTLSSEAWRSVGSSNGSKLIISNGDQTTQPFNFINQTMITKDILIDKKDSKILIRSIIK